MKLNKVLLSLCFIPLIWGCKKNPVISEPEIPQDEMAQLEEEKPEEEIETLVPSVVLAPSAGLNLFGRDKKMHRMSGLSAGNILETVQINNDTQIFSVEADGKKDSYFHGVYDNVDYWIYADYVAPNSKPAIIIEADGALKYSQIVAVSLEEKDAESEKEIFAESESENTTEKEGTSSESEEVLVYYYDKTLDKVCSRMIPAEKISTYLDDVEMASIIQKLRVTTRATPRNELFLRAEKLNPSPAMKRILDAEKTEKISYDYQEVLKAMPGAKYVVNVEELNTVDQSKDPFSN